MIGTIRKHSKALWLVIVVLTVISFVYWGGQRGGGGAGATRLGSINGVPVTLDNYRLAEKEAQLDYAFQAQRWPDNTSEIQQRTYLWLMFIQRQQDLGIYIDDETVTKIAALRLQEAAREKGQPLSLADFTKSVLTPHGLTTDDFERYIRHFAGLQILQEMAAMGGSLVSPMELRSLYAQQNEELTVQAAVFPASNYLSAVTVKPEALGQFFTNQMVNYRLPDRVQVNYIKFPASNYLAEVTKFLSDTNNLKGATNFAQVVEAQYQAWGSNEFKDIKDPAEAKRKTEERIYKMQTLNRALQKANEAGAQLYDMATNIQLFAKNQGFTVEVSEPFSEMQPPKSLNVGADFGRAAFGLSPEAPVGGPITGEDAVYIMTLKAKFPSENRPFEAVRDQVTQDYKMSEARQLARKAGEAFSLAVTNGLVAGKTFLNICSESKVKPVIPAKPISRSTEIVPEIDGVVDLRSFIGVSFLTPVGKASSYAAVGDSGFVVFVSARLPLDETKMKAQMPAFAQRVRSYRQQEAFSLWYQQQLMTGLQGTPLNREPEGPQRQ